MNLRTTLFAAAAIAASFAPAAIAEDAEVPRGIVRAIDEAWLSSDLGLPIIALPFKEGDFFNRGDLLAEFDCDSIRSQLTAAEAKLDAESILLKNSEQLKKHNAGGQFDVDIAKTKVAEAGAEVESLNIAMRRCKITAPFNGRIAGLNARLFETPERGARILQVVDNTSLEVDMILPSQWLKWLKPGMKFEVAVEETGASAAAEVVRIAAVIDPVSQTVKVTGRLTGATGGVLPGMSGPAMFRLPNG